MLWPWLIIVVSIFSSTCANFPTQRLPLMNFWTTIHLLTITLRWSLEMNGLKTKIWWWFEETYFGRLYLNQWFPLVPFLILQNSSMADNEVMRSIIHLFLEDDKPTPWLVQSSSAADSSKMIQSKRC